MLIYIHTHYADELSLKDIADAGTMSILYNAIVVSIRC